jgi:hypothetical protein
MKTNIYFIIVTVLVFLAGVGMGKHSQPMVQETKVPEVDHFSSTPHCLIAGAVRGTGAGKVIVFLPGVRMVLHEEDVPAAFWFPVASLKDIGQEEKVMAVVARPTMNDNGWVVFASQRAVLLNRNEISQLLVDRFASIDEHDKLMYRRLR